MIPFLALIMLTPAFESYGQQKSNSHRYPMVGDTILDHRFSDTENFPKGKKQISDFRGSWLIIDFWTYYCGSCIASFPKMDRLQDRFKEQVHLLMIGGYLDRGKEKTRDEYQKTRNIYNRMKNIHDLDFAVAFDSLVIEKYDLGGVPTILLVDPAGIIRAKISSIDETQMAKVLLGEMPLFKRAFSAHEEVEFNKNLPLLTNGRIANGGVDTSFLYRSLLKLHEDKYGVPTRFANLVRENSPPLQSGKLEVYGQSLEQLYLLAYFGRSIWTRRDSDFRGYSRNLVLQIADSTDFMKKNGEKKLYDYSLIVPRTEASKTFFQHAMQKDLKRFFNYSVTIERRKMPAYHLVVIDPEKTFKLKTEGGAPSFTTENKYFGYKIVNFPFEDFMAIFNNVIPSDGRYYPLTNKTGLNFNVDISINANMGDINEVNEELTVYGLQLKKGTQDMMTLVLN